ncbi:hypothetical protein [Sphingomonas yantingensis]|uniref:Uncharacterized protein n=1 Tax=Sphingomonas yantingensis TaxID=1241761 RepID=A0A7W9AQC3_9SPHN|nr:hypothetical protein [Sphingomonas yantingensis]MBB5698511.1 hypothetical protein [Sphingomonas yantingensis]
MFLFVELREEAAAAAINAIAPFLIGQPKLFAAQPTPDSQVPEYELKEFAQKIAAHIAPKGNQPARLKALQVVFTGHDTFLNQGGEPDSDLRNAVSALSRSLRVFTASSSPLDILCTRIKEYFLEGPYKGKYRGTYYRPTKLGEYVYQILQNKYHLMLY